MNLLVATRLHVKVALELCLTLLSTVFLVTDLCHWFGELEIPQDSSKSWICLFDAWKK